MATRFLLFVTRRDYCPRLLSLRLMLRRRRKFFRASKRTRQHERERELKLARRARKKGAHAKKKTRNFEVSIMTAACMRLQYDSNVHMRACVRAFVAPLRRFNARPLNALANCQFVE